MKVIYTNRDDIDAFHALLETLYFHRLFADKNVYGWKVRHITVGSIREDRELEQDVRGNVRIAHTFFDDEESYSEFRNDQ